MDQKKSSPKRIMSDIVVSKKKTVSMQALFVSPEKNKRTIVERTIQKKEFYEDIPIDNDREDFAYIQKMQSHEKNSGGVFWFISFIGIIALAIGVGGLFMHATIDVTLKKFFGPINISLTMSQVRTANDLTFATATETFTKEQTVPAMSFASSTSNATGIVRFYNTGTSSQVIRMGAPLVSSSGNQYTTDARIVIPARRGKIPGQVDVTVTAVQPGMAGDDGLDDFTFLNTEKGLSDITIRSVDIITGGESAQDAIADPNQIAQAEAQLQSDFSDTSTLIQRITDEIPADMLVLPIVFPTSAPTISTEADYSDGVHITASETVTIVLVSKSDIGTMLGNSLSVLSGVPLILPNFNGLTVTTTNTIFNRVVPPIINIRVSGNVTLLGQINPDEIKSGVVGLSRKAAAQKIEAEPAVAAFDIHITPFWRRILPLDADKISVQVNNP